jgi:hypothetical protein
MKGDNKTPEGQQKQGREQDRPGGNEQRRPGSTRVASRINHSKGHHKTGTVKASNVLLQIRTDKRNGHKARGRDGQNQQRGQQQNRSGQPRQNQPNRQQQKPPQNRGNQPNKPNQKPESKEEKN